MVDHCDDFDFDVAVIGAGFGGITAVHKLGGAGLRVRAFDAAPSVGGTWYWNRYPGARVDIESLEYSLPFPELQRDWKWSEKYAGQPELLTYMKWVVDQLHLEDRIELNTRLITARFDDQRAGWDLIFETNGERRQVTAKNLLLATGFLSVPNVPRIPGLTDFEGEYLHSTAWPEDGVDLTGKRVGVLGTAASGVQIIQSVAPVVEHLTVFQRTANWCSPLRNEKMRPDYQQWVHDNYDMIRELEYGSPGSGAVLVGNVLNPPRDRMGAGLDKEELYEEWESRWSAGGPHLGRSYSDVIRDRTVNTHLRDFLAQKIEELVDDPETARKLTPVHPPLTRRPPGDTNYYQTYNRPNVELVDVKADPIERVVADGVLLQSGAHHPLDVFVLATGFDAGSGAALSIDIQGKGGRALRDHWADGARTQLGFMTSGFPNMFFLNGAQSPGVHFSPPLLGAYQVDYLLRLLTAVDSSGSTIIDVTPESEERWTTIVGDIYAATLIPETDSWWMGANIPGKPRRPVAFAGGFPAYRKYMEEAFEDNLSGYVTEASLPRAVASA
jgi:cyclohexanone monooxygenase